MKRILACIFVFAFMAVAAGCASDDDEYSSKPKKQVYEGARPAPTKNVWR